jgi:hypothetical protein
LIGIASCKKEVIPSEPQYIDQWWDEYYGTYTVFDTANDITYQMEIKQIERQFDGLIFKDSVSFVNVANKFKVGRLFEQNIIYTNGPSIGIFNPVMDSDENQWSFSAGLLKKVETDTLELHYTLSNAQYYLAEDIPFQACYNCIDLAVKNE